MMRAVSTRFVIATGLLATFGCASTRGPQAEPPTRAAYEPVRRPAPDVTPPGTRPAQALAADPSQPGCQELSHQPFPTFGNDGPVDELTEAITKVPPTYPAGPDKGVEGTILVRGLVCEHGRVMKTEVMKSIPMLDQAAREAMMQWTFKPALRGGQPVAVWVTVPMRFTLEKIR